eukprot:9227632-Alexandrium_andersonii.AAC.1
MLWRLPGSQHSAIAEHSRFPMRYGRVLALVHSHAQPRECLLRQSIAWFHTGRTAVYSGTAKLDCHYMLAQAFERRKRGKLAYARFAPAP